VEQFERLLRAIYRPQNVYCIHVDNKSSDLIKQAIKSIVDCFDNIFISTKLENVIYASIYRLKADLNCMSDLFFMNNKLNHTNLKSKRVVDWKYMVNYASTEFPLRTNYELARILDMYNGSNEIDIDKDMLMNRLDKKYIFHTDSEHPLTLDRTDGQNNPPPHGFVITKSLAYYAVHKSFVNYTLNSPYAKDLLMYANDTYSPDEW
jgi:hypothetical protein